MNRLLRKYISIILCVAMALSGPMSNVSLSYVFANEISEGEEPIDRYAIEEEVVEEIAEEELVEIEEVVEEEPAEVEEVVEEEPAEIEEVVEEEPAEVEEMVEEEPAEMEEVVEEVEEPKEVVEKIEGKEEEEAEEVAAEDLIVEEKEEEKNEEEPVEVEEAVENDDNTEDVTPEDVVDDEEVKEIVEEEPEEDLPEDNIIEDNEIIDEVEEKIEEVEKVEEEQQEGVEEVILDEELSVEAEVVADEISEEEKKEEVVEVEVPVEEKKEEVAEVEVPEEEKKEEVAVVETPVEEKKEEVVADEIPAEEKKEEVVVVDALVEEKKEETVVVAASDSEAEEIVFASDSEAEEIEDEEVVVEEIVKKPKMLGMIKQVEKPVLLGGDAILNHTFPREWYNMLKLKNPSINKDNVWHIYFQRGGVRPSDELPHAALDNDDNAGLVAYIATINNIIIYVEENGSLMIDGSCENMFSDFVELRDISFKVDGDWLSAKPVTMANMFRGCKALTSVTFDNFDITTLKDMHGMFEGCESLVSMTFDEDEGDEDTGFIRTGNLIIEDVSSMFKGCKSLENADLAWLFDEYGTQKVKTFAYMFDGCESLINVDFGANNFNSSLLQDTGIKDTSFMFRGCTNLKGVSTVDERGYNYEFNIINFLLGELDTAQSMFEGCASLEKIRVTNTKRIRANSFKDMFSGCTSLKVFGTETVKDKFETTYFRTEKTTDMSGMFAGCESIANLDLLYWDVQNVTDMSKMFEGCKALRTLNLSTFVTDKVRYMKNMFKNCSNIERIYVSNKWSIDAVDDIGEDMFIGCTNIKGQHGQTYVESSVDDARANYNEEGYLNEKPFHCVHIIFVSTVSIPTIPTQSIIPGNRGHRVDDPVAEGYEFEGWFIKPERTEAWNVDEEVMEDTYVYAKWKELTYTMNYVLGPDATWVNVFEPQTVRYYSQEVPLPTYRHVYRFRYNFEGWYDNADFEGDPYEVVPANKAINYTFYAKWAFDLNYATYSITYILNGGDWIDGFTPKTIRLGMDSYELPTNDNMFRDGYTLMSWHLDELCESTPVEAIKSGTFEDVTVYANWQGNRYGILYELNGGRWSKAAMEASPSVIPQYRWVYEETELPGEEALDHDFAVFRGWYYDKALKRPVYRRSETEPQIISKEERPVTKEGMATSSFLFYAKWSPYVRVTFDLGISTAAAPEPQDLVREEKATKPDDPENIKGFIFGYWYLDDENVAYDFDTPVLTDITLRARWIDYETVIYCDATGVACQVRDDYSGEYKKLESTDPGYALIVYKKWTEDLVLPDNKDVYINSLYALKNWYVYKYVTLDGKEIKVPTRDRQYVTNYDAFDEELLSYKEVWLKPNFVTGHKVAFESRMPGVTPPYTRYVEHGATISEPVEERERMSKQVPGFEFDRWVYKHEEVVYEFFFDTTPIENDYILEAVWKEKSYKINYHFGEGERFVKPEWKTKQRKYTEPFVLPTAVDVAKPGYRFLGWYDNEALVGEPILEIPAYILGDVDVYPAWDESPYQINYDIDIPGFESKGGHWKEEYIDRVPRIRNYGEAVKLPTDEYVYNDEESFVFMGWYDNEACEGKPIKEIEESVMWDVTLYARWEQFIKVNFVFIDEDEMIKDGVDMDELAIPSQFVKKGELAERPKVNPSCKGWSCREREEDNIYIYYEARDWESPSVKPFDFDNMPIVGNIGSGEPYKQNIFIKMYKVEGGLKQCVVTFHTDFAKDQTPKPQYIIAGDYAQEPDAPEFTGYKLKYWHINGEGRAFDFEGRPITGDLHLYATFEQKKYILNFEPNTGIVEGGIYYSQTRDIEQNFEMPTAEDIIFDDETKRLRGYEIEGWYTNPEFEGDGIKVIPAGIEMQEETTYYAKWIKATYNIDYDTKGGVMEEETHTTRKYEEAVVTPKNVTMPGNTFLGWYEDPDGTGERVDEIPALRDSDIELYAKWSIDQYTINYEVNGGEWNEGFTPITTRKYNDVIYLDQSGDADPKKQIFYNDIYHNITRYDENGKPYTLVGWYLDKNLTEQKVNKLGKGGAVTLYARWGNNPHKVTFNLNGYVNQYGQTSFQTNVYHNFLIDEPLETDAKIKRTGYDFYWWYKDRECTKKWIFEVDRVTEDVTLYASYKPATYVINYDLDGGIWTKPPVTRRKYDETVTLPDETYVSKLENEFLGWYTIGGGKMIRIDAETEDRDIKLYARWKECIYQVHFNKNGYGEEDVVKVPYRSLLEKPEDPVAEGVIFEGWYMDHDCTIPWIFEEYVVNDDMTLYAKWEKAITVTFNVNNTACKTEIPPQYLKKGDKVTKPANPVADGWTFNRWNINGKEYNFNTLVTADITLVAQWTKKPTKQPTPAKTPTVTPTAKWTYSSGGGGNGGGGGGGSGNSGGGGIPLTTLGISDTTQTGVLQPNAAAASALTALGITGVPTKKLTAPMINYPPIAPGLYEFSKQGDDSLELVVSFNDTEYKMTNGLYQVVVMDSTVPTFGFRIDSYYMDENGNVYAGLLEDELGEVYHFSQKPENYGRRSIGWTLIGANDCRFFGIDGKMVRDGITPDGIPVGSDGKIMDPTLASMFVALLVNM